MLTSAKDPRKAAARHTQEVLWFALVLKMWVFFQLRLKGQVIAYLKKLMARYVQPRSVNGAALLTTASASTAELAVWPVDAGEGPAVLSPTPHSPPLHCGRKTLQSCPSFWKMPTRLPRVPAMQPQALLLSLPSSRPLASPCAAPCALGASDSPGNTISLRKAFSKASQCPARTSDSNQSKHTQHPVWAATFPPSS